MYIYMYLNKLLTVSIVWAACIRCPHLMGQERRKKDWREGERRGQRIRIWQKALLPSHVTIYIEPIQCHGDYFTEYTGSW